MAAQAMRYDVHLLFMCMASSDFTLLVCSCVVRHGHTEPEP